MAERLRARLRLARSVGSPTKPQTYRTTNRGTVQSVILVTGPTGNVGRHVVSQLRTGPAIRGLTGNPDSAVLPGDVVHADLFVPTTPDTGLDGVDAIFLGWPFFMAEAAPAFLDAVVRHGRPIVYLSSESVGDKLEQQTNTITLQITAKLAA